MEPNAIPRLHEELPSQAAASAATAPIDILCEIAQHLGDPNSDPGSWLAFLHVCKAFRDPELLYHFSSRFQKTVDIRRRADSEAREKISYATEMRPESLNAAKRLQMRVEDWRQLCRALSSPIFGGIRFTHLHIAADEGSCSLLSEVPYVRVGSYALAKSFPTLESLHLTTSEYFHGSLLIFPSLRELYVDCDCCGALCIQGISALLRQCPMLSFLWVKDNESTPEFELAQIDIEFAESRSTPLHLHYQFMDNIWYDDVHDYVPFVFVGVSLLSFDRLCVCAEDEFGLERSKQTCRRLANFPRLSASPSRELSVVTFSYSPNKELELLRSCADALSPFCETKLAAGTVRLVIMLESDFDVEMDENARRKLQHLDELARMFPRAAIVVQLSRCASPPVVYDITDVRRQCEALALANATTFANAAT